MKPLDTAMERLSRNFEIIVCMKEKKMFYGFNISLKLLKTKFKFD
jgi:hypothetical protein